MLPPERVTPIDPFWLGGPITTKTSFRELQTSFWELQVVPKVPYAVLNLDFLAATSTPLTPIFRDMSPARENPAPVPPTALPTSLACCGSTWQGPQEGHHFPLSKRAGGMRGALESGHPLGTFRIHLRQLSRLLSL